MRDRRLKENRTSGARAIWGIIVCLMVLLKAVAATAQTDSNLADKDLPYIIFAEDAQKEASQVDSIFFLRALPIVFPVSKTIVADDDPALLHFIEKALPLLSDGQLKDARIRVRSAASPEGPFWFNQELSRGRRDALLRIFRDHGVKPASMQIDVVDEEYELLAFFMRQAGDPDAARVTDMVGANIKKPALLKRLLQKEDGGALWGRLLREYFPQLRASRFVIVLPRTKEADFYSVKVGEISQLPFPKATLTPIPVQMPWLPLPAVGGNEVLPPTEETDRLASRVPRRELLAVKTNLLEWGAYVPQYGWCPMPNVELEYYPRHGHWTLGATFDCPWWIGNTTNHKYFELRNYQVYTRFYVRNSNRSYSDVARRIPAYGKAAFRGFYMEAYAGAFLYQIGFSATKGWIGEGVGGGLGLGYVCPISRNGHWRLNFGVQAGMFYTPYDPFVWGKPTYHGGEKDGLYYYNTSLFRDNFVKRQHRYTWLGPTRASITLSYDLLYRRQGRKGPSLHHWEKGGLR